MISAKEALDRANEAADIEYEITMNAIEEKVLEAAENGKSHCEFACEGELGYRVKDSLSDLGYRVQVLRPGCYYISWYGVDSDGYMY